MQISSDELRPLSVALGNTVRFACEFASSLLLISAASRVGLPTILAIYATVACACALLFAALLPEVSVKHRREVEVSRTALLTPGAHAPASGPPVASRGSACHMR